MKAEKTLLLTMAVLALVPVVVALYGCSEDATQTMAGDTENTTTTSLVTTTATSEATTTTTASTTTAVPSSTPTSYTWQGGRQAGRELETPLPNGHTQALIYLRLVGPPEGEVPGNIRQINFHYAETLTDEETRQAALEGGVITPEGVEASTTISITTYTFGDGGEQTITWDQLVELYPILGGPDEHWSNALWMMERDEVGELVSLTEQPSP